LKAFGLPREKDRQGQIFLSPIVGDEEKRFYSINALGQFVEQKLMLRSSFRCDRSNKCQGLNFGQTLLAKLCIT